MYKFLGFLLIVFIIGYGVMIVNRLSTIPDRPNLDLDRWWGNEPKKEDEDLSIRQFKVEFNNSMINDLKQRLKNRRSMTPPLDGAQSEYGMNTIYLEKVLDYWANEYNFKGREEILNKFTHYKTKIQGLDIQFIKATPKRKQKSSLFAVPLLLLHGWPSSSKEFVKIIPTLTTPKAGFDFVFELIIPDLPGFGFSEGTRKPGLSAVQLAIIMRNLMLRLGYDKYYVQGGDWGSQCGMHLATLFPEEVLGFHTNMPFSSRPISTLKLLTGSLFPSLLGDKYFSRVYPLSNHLEYIIRESGYFHLQATKPDTLGVGLSDSPSGLASYLMEKMAMCTNSDQLDTLHGGLEDLDIEDVLDTLTIMWANNAVVTSMRIYAESMKWPEIYIVHKIPTPVPTAAIKFKYEVLYQPDWILRDKFPNLVRSTSIDYGGHFAAMQTPVVFANDIFESVAEFISFHKKSKVRHEI